MRRLEEQPCATRMLNHAEGEVDKSVLVIGCCAGDLLEQAAEMVRDMLANVGGFEDGNRWCQFQYCPCKL